MDNKCNVSFQSKYAKKNGDLIDIYTFLEGNNDNTHLFCIPSGHELIPVRCTKRHPHFRHKHDSDLTGTPMTQWHSEWQSNFPVTEIPFPKKPGQSKDRRADVVLPDFSHIIEIQHSKIDREDVDQRMKDYKCHNHGVKWIIDAQDSIIVKRMGERLILEFSKNTWLYENFRGCEYVYYDINGLIFRVNPSIIKHAQIDVLEPKTKAEFIEALKANNTLWNVDPPQCYLHLKQQGAGSGKTYGMMQLINRDPETCHYKYIVFLTKQHSAVAVMYNEFKEQYENDRLDNIEDVELTYDPKKYIITFRNKMTNVEVQAIFATVDSFTHALGESPKSARDKFIGIVQSIKNGTIKTTSTGTMKYANVNPILNKEMLIMIDETQDLTELYGEAFLEIVKSKYANLCVVGDRLQSLAHMDNALTYLHKVEGFGLKVIKPKSSNTVRRFSDPKLIKFVNDMIPFETYDLPPMEPHKLVESRDDCLTIFQAKTVYANSNPDSDEVTDAITEIMNLYTKEVEENNRIPEDFLIVTPITSKNPLMESLELALNMYWKKTMESDSYILKVKSKHEYWKDINTSEYTRYAIFHKSQEGSSINTKESEHATRMVSIHSSKGDGRKVVFVIGLSESSLRLFSQVSNNLVYDSLLHVAITRQKEKLYFRLEPNGDDVHNKIVKTGISQVISNTEFNFLKNRFNTTNITRNLCTFSYDDIYAKIIAINPPPKLPNESDSKLLIDMGDHHIRYASIAMNVMVHSCNYSLKLKEVKKQFYAIFKELTEAKIETVNSWKEYLTLLNKNKIKPTNDNEKVIKYIPILQYPDGRDNLDYNKYYIIIERIIKCIMKKLNGLGREDLDYFCPIESIVLYYMIESVQNGKYQKINIGNLYTIIDTYSKVFKESPGHDNCDCNNTFKSVNNLSESQKKHQEYLCNHYERLQHITVLLDRFNTTYKGINWLYSHPVNIGENKDFKIENYYNMIGYNDTNVYIVTIKPQLNDLNYNEFIVDSIVDTYLIMNTPKLESGTDIESKNYKKFNGKRVLSCVLSMNKDDIFTVDWTSSVKDNAIYIRGLMSDMMIKHFGNMHLQYYNTFNNIVDLNSDNTPESIVEMCNNKLNDANNPPLYLEKFFNKIEGDIDECNLLEEKKEIIDKYSKKNKFLNLMNNMLNKSIKTFLGIRE
jgi:hypothetical protein